jgi:hypothetical protein
MKLFTTIAKAWNAFVRQKKLLPLIVLIDILFVYGMTRLSKDVLERAQEHVMKLTVMTTQQVQEMAETEAVQTAMLQSQEFLTAYHQLLNYVGLFFIGAFAVWTLGKGLAWYLSHSTVEEKIPAGLFALKFTGMSAFWFVAFMLITVVALSLFDYVLFGVFPLINKAAANAFIVLLYWVLAYFVFISCALVPHKTFRNTFRLGILRWKELLPVHIVGSLIFFVATTVPASIVKHNVPLSFAFIIFLALPGVAFARVLWSIAIHEVAKNAS